MSFLGLGTQKPAPIIEPPKQDAPQIDVADLARQRRLLQQRQGRQSLVIDTGLNRPSRSGLYIPTNESIS